MENEKRMFEGKKRGEMMEDKIYSVPELEAIRDVNKSIAERQGYGLRVEEAESDGIRLMWSNGGANWFPYSNVRKGDTLTLDANEIVAYIDPVMYDRIKDKFGVLPLYCLSTEAKERGEAPADATLIWAAKQLESRIDLNK